jgi:hypothetical protein
MGAPSIRRTRSRNCRSSSDTELFTPNRLAKRMPVPTLDPVLPEDRALLGSNPSAAVDSNTAGPGGFGRPGRPAPAGSTPKRKIPGGLGDRVPQRWSLVTRAGSAINEQEAEFRCYTGCPDFSSQLMISIPKLSVEPTGAACVVSTLWAGLGRPWLRWNTRPSAPAAHLHPPPWAAMRPWAQLS